MNQNIYKDFFNKDLRRNVMYSVLGSVVTSAIFVLTNSERMKEYKNNSESLFVERVQAEGVPEIRVGYIKNESTGMTEKRVDTVYVVDLNKLSKNQTPLY